MDFTLDEASTKLQAEIAAFAKKEMPKDWSRALLDD